MSVLSWIFFGLIAGFVASRIVNSRGEGCMIDVALGLVGAIVGGGLFSPLGKRIFRRLDLRSMFATVIGAIVALVPYHAATGRRGIR